MGVGGWYAVFVKITAISFDYVTVLISLTHRMPRSRKYKKIIYPIKRSDFLFTGSQGKAFQVKKFEAILFEVISRRIDSSTNENINYFLMLGPSRA